MIKEAGNRLFVYFFQSGPLRHSERSEESQRGFFGSASE